MRYDIEYMGKVQAQQRPRGRAMAGRNGKTFVKMYDERESRDFKSALHLIAQSEVIALKGKPIDTACMAKITVFFPIPKSFSKKKREQIFLGQLFPIRKPDVDNLCKSALDAVSGVLFQDDRLVVECTVRKQYAENEGLHMSIITMDELEF